MVGISVISNFEINGSFPIDSRLIATNLTERDSISYKYDGLKVYITEDKKTYTWDGSDWIEDMNGIYGGSGSLVNNTIVNMGNDSSFGSQSYYLNMSSNYGILNRIVDSLSVFKKYSTKLKFVKNLSDYTTILSCQSFTHENILFSINNKDKFGITSSGIMIFNEYSNLTYSSTITFNSSFINNVTYSLPLIGGTFAMTDQLSQNTLNLNEITSLGNTTSNDISIYASIFPETLNLRQPNKILQYGAFTTFWYANYASSGGPGTYFGIKSDGNSVDISPVGADGTSTEMRRVLRMFSGTASNSYSISNLNVTNGFEFKYRNYLTSTVNNTLIGCLDLSNNRYIYFPDSSGTVSIWTTPVTGQSFKSTSGWIKTYDTTTTTTLTMDVTDPMTLQYISKYSGTAGGYVQINRPAGYNNQYIQLPNPITRSGEIINFLHYNWNTTLGFDIGTISMTGSSEFTISNGEAYWDYQIGLTGGFTNSWYGGKTGALISDGTKWIKMNYDYTKVDINNSPTSNFNILNSYQVSGKSPFTTLGFSRTTIGKISGKWYWETRINLENGTCNGQPKVGIAQGTGLPGSSTTLGTSNYSIGVIGDTSNAGVYTLSSVITYIGTTTDLTILNAPSSLSNITSGEVIGHALDLDSSPKTYTVYRGGTDPSNIYFKINLSSAPFGNYWHPALCSDGTTNSVIGNFGQFGFSYSPPSGFNRGIFFKGWEDSTILRTNQGIGW